LCAFGRFLTPLLREGIQAATTRQSDAAYHRLQGRKNKKHRFIRLLVEQAAIRELKKANLMILTLITADFL
jgi:hypothetical protein